MSLLHVVSPQLPPRNTSYLVCTRIFYTRLQLSMLSKFTQFIAVVTFTHTHTNHTSLAVHRHLHNTQHYLTTQEWLKVLESNQLNSITVRLCSVYQKQRQGCLSIIATVSGAGVCHLSRNLGSSMDFMLKPHLFITNNILDHKLRYDVFWEVAVGMTNWPRTQIPIWS